MSRNRPPEILGPALCGFGCGRKWEKWCKGCNLVFCAAHVDMKAHKCKRNDLERGCSGFGPPKKPKKQRPKPDPAKSDASPTNGAVTQSELPMAPPEEKPRG